MAFVQGCSEFRVFSSSVFTYLSGMKVNDLIVDTLEVADEEASHLISQVITDPCFVSCMPHA